MVNPSILEKFGCTLKTPVIHSVAMIAANMALDMQTEKARGKHTQKGIFILSYPHTPATTPINSQYYQAVFDHVLTSLLYPTQCDCGATCDRAITNRLYSLKCPECLSQKSKLSHTPFRNLSIPQWMAGWAIEDVSEAIQGKDIVHADTMVLYSMRDRFGRKRHKNRGLTSSIYRSKKLGGQQVGTLVHQITNSNWVLLDSISNLTANTVGPLIRRSLPRNTVLFTDRDYTWLFRIYPNHRMVKHSLKSKDKRYKFSCDRWCQHGVHNQKSEGLNGSIKTTFRAYTYIRPEFSTMYLNEWAFFKNLKHFSLEKISEALRGEKGSVGIR